MGPRVCVSRMCAGGRGDFTLEELPHLGVWDGSLRGILTISNHGDVGLQWQGGMKKGCEV